MHKLLVTLAVCVGLEATAQLDAAAVYEEGKALYDAKDYAGALHKFDDCVVLEPKKARWHYNRGLALKKLSRDAEAREALLESRRLEPDYKRAEIDQKLSELGEAGTEPAALTRGGSLICCAAPLCPVLVIAFVVLMRRKRPSASVPAPVPSAQRVQNDRASLDDFTTKLGDVALALSNVEHGLSLGEDPQARAHIDRAATNFASVRLGLAAAWSDERPLRELEDALARASDAIEQAKARLLAVHGPSSSSSRGPRAGCFFCARPLPTAAAGVAVELQQVGQTTTVAACSVCARRAAAGNPAPVVMVGDRHWSEVDDFDPYVHGHLHLEGAREAPAWQALSGPRTLPSLATLAGGAVLGGLGAAAVGRLLDLDALKVADLASTAAAEAARASTRSSSTFDTDHS